MPSPEALTVAKQLDALLFLLETQLEGLNAAALPDNTIVEMAKTWTKLGDQIKQHTTGKMSDSLLFLLKSHLDGVDATELHETTISTMSQVSTQLGDHVTRWQAVKSSTCGRYTELEASTSGGCTAVEASNFVAGRQLAIIPEQQGVRWVEPTEEEIAEFGYGALAKEEIVDDGTGKAHFVRTVQDSKGFKSKRMSVRELDECFSSEDGSASSTGVSYATTTFEGDVGRRTSVKMHNQDATMVSVDGIGMLTDGSVATQVASISYSGSSYSEATTDYVGNYSKRASMHCDESVHAQNVGSTADNSGGALVPVDTSAVREEKRSYAVTESVIVDDQVQSIRVEDRQHRVEDAMTGQILGAREETIETQAVTDMLTGMHDEIWKVDYVEDLAVPAPPGSQAISDGDSNGQAMAVAGGDNQLVRTHGATTGQVSADLVLGAEKRVEAHSFQAVDVRTGQLLKQGDGVREKLSDEFGTDTVADYAVFDAVTGIVDEGSRVKSVARGLGENGSDVVAVMQEQHLVDAFTGALIEHHYVDQIADAAGESTTSHFAIADGTGLVHEGGATRDVVTDRYTGTVQSVESSSHAVVDALTGATLASSATATQAIADQAGESAVHQYSTIDCSGILREGEATHTTQYSVTGESQTTQTAFHVGYDVRTGQLVEQAQTLTEGAQGALGDGVTVQRYAIADGSGVVQEGTTTTIDTVSQRTGAVASSTMVQQTTKDAKTGQMLEVADVIADTGADGKITIEGARSYVDPRTGKVVTERVGGPKALGNGEPPQPSASQAPPQAAAPNSVKAQKRCSKEYAERICSAVLDPPTCADDKQINKRPDDKEIAHPRRERRVMQFDPEQPTNEEIAEFGQDAVVTLVKGEHGALIRTVTDAKGHRSRRQSVKRIDVDNGDGVKQAAVSIGTTEFTGDKGHRHSVKVSAATATESGERDRAYGEALTEYSGATAKRISVHERDCMYVDQSMASIEGLDMAALENGEASYHPADAGEVVVGDSFANAAPMMVGSCRTYAVTDIVLDGDFVVESRKEEKKETIADARTGEKVASHGQVATTKAVTDQLVGTTDVQGSTHYVTYSKDATRTEGVVEKGTFQDHISGAGGTTTVHSTVIHDAVTGQMIGSSKVRHDTAADEKGQDSSTVYQITDMATGTVNTSQKIKSIQALRNGECAIQELEQNEVSDIGGALLHAEAVSTAQGKVTQHEVWYADPVTGKLRHEVVLTGNQPTNDTSTTASTSSSPTAPAPAPPQPAPPAQARSPTSKTRPGPTPKPAAPAPASQAQPAPETPRGQVSCHFRMPVLKSATEKAGWSHALVMALAAVGGLQSRCISVVGSVELNKEWERIEKMIEGGTNGSLIALARWNSQLGDLAQPCSIVVLRLSPVVEWTKFSEKVTKVLTQRKSAATRNEAARVLGAMVNPEAVDLLLD